MDCWRLGLGAIVIALLVIAFILHGKGCSKGSSASVENFDAGLCSSTWAPDAQAEAEALRQTGWRVQKLPPPWPDSTKCGDKISNEAMAEAHALQSANALPSASLYYTQDDFGVARPEQFTSANQAHYAGRKGLIYSNQDSASPGGLEYEKFTADEITCDGGYASGAQTEAAMLAAAQGDEDVYDVDEFAARNLGREQAAYGSQLARYEGMRANNAAHTSAHRARINSMSEAFSAPSSASAPIPPDFAAVSCISSCIDGCTGTSCQDLCKEQCLTRTRATEAFY